MTPWHTLQPINKHFQVILTQAAQVLSYTKIITLGLYGEYRMSLLARYKEKYYWYKQDKVVT